MVPGKDVLVFVSIHNPANPEQVLEELVVLGTTTLEEWKDAIDCVSNLQAAEIGLPPKRDGYLVVEGVFYNDMRGLPAPPPPDDPSHQDFSPETSRRKRRGRRRGRYEGGGDRAGDGSGSGARREGGRGDDEGRARARARGSLRDEPEEEEEETNADVGGRRSQSRRRQVAEPPSAQEADRWPYKGPYLHPKPPVPHPATAAAPPID